ncbi:MAG TPA: protein translocase subunit SecF, partial [bacterium]|nr:protein translocase subunit SecF [bacterium]
EKLDEIRTLLNSNNIQANIQIFGKLGSEVNKIKISTASDPLIESKITGIFQKHFDKDIIESSAVDGKVAAVGENSTAGGKVAAAGENSAVNAETAAGEIPAANVGANGVDKANVGSVNAADNASSKIDINLLKSSAQISENLKAIFIQSAVESVLASRPFNDMNSLNGNLKKFNLSESELNAIFILTDAGISDVRKNINSLDNAGLINVFTDIFSSVKFIEYFNANANKAVDYIDKSGGLIKSVEDLNQVFEFDSTLFDKFKSQFSTSSFIVESVSMVGPSIGADYRKKGALAIIVSLIAILAYIAWRFEIEYAIGAVIALGHDVLITIGIFSMLDKEFTTQILAALLTLVGYSINDTIVVYDRIRENLKAGANSDIEKVMNTSIIQTLSRTTMTSLTTMIAVAAIYYFGGEVTKDFALALLIGIIVGTYSSIFVASPVVLIWKKKEAQKNRAVKK